MTKQEKAIAVQLEKLKVRHLAARQFKQWRHEQDNPAPPKPKPIPEHIANSPAALSAYGYLVAPQVELGVSEEWEQTVTERAGKREALNNSPCGIHAWEQDFERAEDARRALAARLLLSAMSPGLVAVKSGLSHEQVAELKAEINL
jgi:hypothetical protein